MLLFTVENLNAILGWVAIMLVARRMGAGTLGELAYALSLVGGFSFLAFLGFRMAHVKRVSEGMDLGRCIGTFLTMPRALRNAAAGIDTDHAEIEQAIAEAERENAQASEKDDTK